MYIFIHIYCLLLYIYIYVGGAGVGLPGAALFLLGTQSTYALRCLWRRLAPVAVLLTLAEPPRGQDLDFQATQCPA